MWQNIYFAVKKIIVNKIRSFSAREFLLSIIPVLQWLPLYEWRKDLIGDITGGITVAIMHVPQVSDHPHRFKSKAEKNNKISHEKIDLKQFWKISVN